MTARQRLESAKSLKMRIATMQEQLAYLKSAAEYVSPQFDGMPKSPTRNVHKNEDKYIRILEKQEQIQAAQAELDEIAAAIDEVGSPPHHAILFKRYILGTSWFEIAQSLFISERRAYQLHTEALEKIAVNFS